MFTNVLNFLNGNLGLITLVVGCFAIGLYRHQKNDDKREIARLILEEIRYAEKHIKVARERGNVFIITNQLLPTNSWYSNIHLFVGDFRETDRDSISDFYSKVIFLDRAIDKIAEFKISNLAPVTTTALSAPAPSGGSTAAVPPAAPFSPASMVVQQVQFQFQLSAEIILKEIADKVEFLYNTPAADKLRELSERNWHQL